MLLGEGGVRVTVAGRVRGGKGNGDGDGDGKGEDKR